MTHPEALHALEKAVLLVDTREQDTPRLRARLAQIGLPFEREKLDFGDYSLKIPLPCGQEWSLSKIAAIERKMSIDELCQSFLAKSGRFAREFERAAGSKLYLLVEGATWEDVLAGNYRTRLHPHALVGFITAYLVRYNCQILFCKARSSGELIKNILLREARERLEGELEWLETLKP